MDFTKIRRAQGNPHYVIQKPMILIQIIFRRNQHLVWLELRQRSFDDPQHFVVPDLCGLPLFEPVVAGLEDA